MTCLKPCSAQNPCPDCYAILEECESPIYKTKQPEKMKTLTPNQLALYLGCEAIKNDDITKRGILGSIDITDIQHQAFIIPQNGVYYPCEIHEVKLLLRSLVDITEEEVKELGWSSKHLFLQGSVREHDVYLTASEVLILLSKSFDLFGFIENGLAIRKP